MKRLVNPGVLGLNAPTPQARVPAPPRHAMEQGAQWFALLRSGDATEADQLAWRQWLEADPGHRVAWQFVEEVSAGFAMLDAAPSVHWTARTLVAADQQVRRRRRVLAGLAGCASVPLLGMMAWRQEAVVHSVATWTADHRTATGEIRDIVLPDAGRLWLDTRSAVDLDYSAHWRCVRLLCGEMMVATASDRTGRPFLVESRHGRMWALGTRFSVRDREEDRTVLAVHEGVVRIQPASAEHQGVLVQAGEQRMFNRGGVDQRVSSAAQPAWTGRMLALPDGSLDELAAELGRYFRGHIHVAEAVAGLRVFGSFPLHDVHAALKTLESTHPVEVRRVLPWWISVTPRAST